MRVSKTLTWHRIYHVFTYSCFFLIEKDICNRQNISIKLPCVYLCFSSRSLYFFSERLLFHSYFSGKILLFMFYGCTSNEFATFKYIIVICFQLMEVIQMCELLITILRCSTLHFYIHI